MVMTRARTPGQRSGHRSSLLGSLVAVLLLAVVWAIGGPAQFGGPASYVITNGTSMLPNFHSGDLAVTRRAGQYHTGDIVAYRLRSRTVVLHRIVGEDGDRFITKGDNNPSADTARPANGDILGVLWLHIPSAGRLLEQLRRPQIMALVVLLTGVTWAMGRRSGRSGATRQGAVMSNQIKWLAAGPPSPRDERLGLALVAVLVTLALAVIAYSRPVQRPGTADVTYTQRGTFAYSGAASGGVYDGDRATSGQPLYLNVVRNLDVSFNYRLASQAPHNVDGTYRLLMELGQDSGWKRTVEIVPATQFTGDQATINGSIDLTEVRTFIDSFGQQTGLRNGAFTLALVPEVGVQGTLTGSPLADAFSPRLLFHMDSNQLVLDRPPTDGDPLSPARGGSIKLPSMVDNSFSFLGMKLPVTIARLVTLPAFLLAGLTAVGLARPILAARHEDEQARIQARYGPMLLEVRGEGSQPEQPVIEVASIEDLLKLASRDGRMVLHSREAGTHQYTVVDGETRYRYRSARTSAIASVRALAPREAAAAGGD